MKYENNRDRLIEILMTAKDISEHKEEILKIVPELIITVDCSQDHPAHMYNVFDHTVAVVNGVGFDLVLKLSALLHDIGKPYVAKYVDGIERFWGHEEVSATLACHILSRLKFENEVVEMVAHLIKHHDHKTKLSEDGVRDTVRIVGEDLMPLFWEHQTADLMAHSPKYKGMMIGHLNQIIDIYKRLYK